MILHRLIRAPFRALDGEGARRFGGRWTSPRRPAIYAAASAGLAVLEILIHLDLPPDLVPLDYRLLEIDLPQDAPVETLSRTPADDSARRRLGDGFLDGGEALALRVPSVIVPSEHNAILNPRHRAMAGVRVIADHPFRFDPRLFRGLGG